ncbi:MAG TPA: UDP-N-acetylmuramoyl-L-alanine--D-glutamate ligase [Terriglobales bacterium]|nr:UDP-N-acetylmuramoyl-L-alanine--D-glutamate ligase [Terriglobales bacterium]
MELAGKNVLIVGFERTGEALCRFLAARGARVLVTEKKTEAELAARIAPWREKGIAFETSGHRLGSFLGADLIIPSPGVPPLPEIAAAREKGIPVLSELELAARFLRGRVVAITGSNGKSTTTALAHKILKEAGLRSRLAGNIGFPLVSFVETSRPDHIYVTEVSSFQLEYTERFKADVAAFLNLSQNHLDWHRTFEAYVAAKKKLFFRLDAGGAAILNRDDPLVWGVAGDTAARVYAFSRKRRPVRGACVTEGWVELRDGGTERLVRTARLPLPGTHNQENVMAAALVGHLLGVPAAAIRRSVLSFRGLEHRLEDVLRFRGVRFVNDSKATTVDATLKALESFDRPVVLILGGRGKGGDFGPLRRAVRARVRSVVLVGEAAPKIESALRDAVPMEAACDYREVVSKAFAAARPGDVVLLAPAATSWDMFRNFEERGRTFKREVRRLAAKAAGRRR